MPSIIPSNPSWIDSMHGAAVHMAFDHGTLHRARTAKASGDTLSIKYELGIDGVGPLEAELIITCNDPNGLFGKDATIVDALGIFLAQLVAQRLS